MKLVVNKAERKDLREEDKSKAWIQQVTRSFTLVKERVKIPAKDAEWNLSVHQIAAASVTLLNTQLHRALVSCCLLAAVGSSKAFVHNIQFSWFPAA